MGEPTHLPKTHTLFLPVLGRRLNLPFRPSTYVNSKGFEPSPLINGSGWTVVTTEVCRISATRALTCNSLLWAMLSVMSFEATVPRAFLIWKAMHSAVAKILQTSVRNCSVKTVMTIHYTVSTHQHAHRKPTRKETLSSDVKK